jgi:hypothetical protein
MKSLTGGTGDVNPQWMHLYFTPTTPGTTQTQAFITSLNRYPQRGGRATVMEILKVYWWYSDTPAVAGAAEVTKLYIGAITTQDHGVVDVTWAFQDCIDMLYIENQGAFTAAGTYMVNCEHIIVHDLTDGAGHGLLVATDTIYAQLQGGATFATGFRAKILYRMKNVSLTEYIGIVQAQQ